MENVSVNTTTQAVATPMTYTAPTAKTPSPVEEIRMDTHQTEQTKDNNKNVDMEKLTTQLNKISQEENLSVSFAYNEKINRVYINVVDKNSGDVIRKLTSEEAMKFAESMQDVLGKLFDTKG